MEHPSEAKLQRKLSPLNVWALALGSIIGWGAFVMPGNTFLPNAGPVGTAIALGIAALIMICIAFNYDYMINHFPVAGGEFTFTNASFGPTVGFICAWFLGLSYLAIVPLNATALALIGRNLFPDLTQWGYLYSVEGYSIYTGELILAIAALLIFAVMSIRGISVAGKFQTALALGLVGSIALLAGATLLSDSASVANMAPAFAADEAGNLNYGGILAVIAVAPWAFVGFDSIPQAAEEFNFSHKKSKIIMVLSILIGAALYIILNTITAAVLPNGYNSWVQYIADTKLDVLPESLNGLSALPTFNAAKLLLGNFGLLILGVALVCAVLSGIIGFYMATSRLLYSMAKEQVLPQWFGKLHPKYNTPSNALIFVLLISLMAPWFGRTVIGWVVDMSSIGAAIGYGLTSASAFVQMRKNGAVGKVMQLNAALGVVFSIFFAALLVVPNPWAYLGPQSRIALLIWCVLGAVFYFVSRKKKA
ncbi:MAG: APC family permease [Oscillospiraceae bacterium]|nr:APC family permease [Oscillospiraceae bacterium]